MYKRSYSLKTRYNFRKVLNSPNEFKTNNLIIKYLKVDDAKKFAVITSNKLSPKAVNQNQIRRIISKTIKDNIDRFPDRYYFVFIPKKNIIRNGKIITCVEEISSEINSFLSKVAFA